MPTRSSAALNFSRMEQKVKVGLGGRVVSEGCGVTKSEEQAPALTEMHWRLVQTMVEPKGKKLSPTETTLLSMEKLKPAPEPGLRVTQS